LSEVTAAQQPWAGQGAVVAPAAVCVLPSKDVLMMYKDGGEDMEQVFKVRAVAGTCWGRCVLVRGSDIACVS
jgi:hypothetical protein